MRQILWGLFKKIIIADRSAIIVNDIFTNYADYSGATLLLGGVFFAFQIYSDFSGYSDIAIGTARLFGFNLMQNFAFPYFSRDIAEFWRRWHISLSTWFRDYLYIPLGGSRGGTVMKIRNTFVIFIVSGFWHGANWTFIFWGALNAFYFLPLMLTNKNRKNTNTVAENKILPSVKEFFQIVITFFITVIAWIFFRAENISHAFKYLKQLFLTIHIETEQSLFFLKNVTTLFIVVLFAFEWLQREKRHALEFNTNTKLSKTMRWILYGCIIAVIYLFAGKQDSFIYFQF
jgi:D-alanyl-lipoteichoic acid acyltransferase DltB (MBOAT superfamily)